MLIDVVREGQKLNKMTSMLLQCGYFRIQVLKVSVRSWVLVIATIGLKTGNRRKRLPHCLLKATPQTPETVGKPKNWNLRGATAESEITPS